MASIDDFIFVDVVLEVLHYFDPQIEIVLGMRVDELTDVLSLVGTFLDDLTVVLEQVAEEELVELLTGTAVGTVLVYLTSEDLAEYQSVCERALNGGQLPQKHE